MRSYIHAREIITIDSNWFSKSDDWFGLCTSLGITEGLNTVDTLTIEYTRAGVSEDEFKTVEQIVKTKKDK
jgi:hypothetical protein